jgi:G3E family GTPase
MRRATLHGVTDPHLTQTNPALSAPAPIPLQIVTGFLGAGKTTLLNRLLKDPALAGALVVVNEFGEVGLDHLLMEAGEEGVVLMESGCLCCTLRGDLVVLLEDLLRRRDNGRIAPFVRVIIETTGLADPAPVIAVVLQHPYLSRRFILDGVVTVVDAVNGLATLEAQEEALRQVAVADRIVLSKTDLAPDDGGLARLRAALGQIAPGASVLDAARGEAGPAALIGLGLFDLASKPEEVDAWLAIAALAGPDGPGSHGAQPGAQISLPMSGPAGGAIRSVVLTASQPVRPQTLDLFWSLMTSTHGPKLLRLKGLADIVGHEGRPVILHAVRQVMQPPEAMAAWPGGDRRTRLVLIVQDLDPDIVQRLWSAFIGQAAAGD